MTSRAPWVEPLAQVLRFCSSIGLCPREDRCLEPWEALSPEMRGLWEAYAKQVRYSVDRLVARPAEPQELPTSEQVMEAVFAGERSTVPTRRYEGLPGGNWVAVERHADGTETRMDLGIPFHPGASVTLQWPGARFPPMFACSRCGAVLGDTPGVREGHRAVCSRRSVTVVDLKLRDLMKKNLGVVVDPVERFLDSDGDVEHRPPECTGVAASWCPIHGDCSCPRDEEGGRIEESDTCPLHGSGSTHADDTLVELARDELERERARSAARGVIIAREFERGRKLLCQRCGADYRTGENTTCFSPGPVMPESPPEHFDHDWAFVEAKS